jgi:benzodiazapine receptor
LISSKNIPTWYKQLVKGKYNPPNWVFGPVWTILYLMIGFSGYLIWSETKSFSGHGFAWFIYFLQLFLNYIWTQIFFGWHMLYFAFIEIVAIDISILLNMLVFYQINSTAALLLIPYFCWVSFASYLTYTIWQLNKNKNQSNNAKILEETK